MALGQFFSIGTPGNNGVECRVFVSIVDDPANNRSSIDAELQFRKNNGFASQGNSFGTFTIHGSGGGITISGNRTLPSNGAWVSFGVSGLQWIGHGADGRAPYTEVRVNGVGISGSSDFDTAVSGTLSFNSTNGFADYTVLPYAPVNLQIVAGSVATTSFGVSYGRNSHDTVLQDHAQWATNSNFATVVWDDYGPGGVTNPNGIVALAPGTQHWVRVRSRTAAGWGPWSASISQTTLPASPPGLTVTASPNGTSVTLVFTPPGGVTGVNPYRYEGYVGGVLTYTGDVNGTTTTINGLTPGGGVAWRASAFIGSYQSPWSDYVTLFQPNPNTNPGAYFDGNTPDTPSTDYSWAGTAHNSTTNATSPSVVGWQTGVAHGATVVLHQATGGFQGAKAARILVTADATAAGAVEAGQGTGVGDRAAVVENTQYVGSLYVNPSRTQRFRAIIYWLNSSGTPFASSNGVDGEAIPGAWTRFTVTATAPAGAAFAIVRALDTAGAGWVAWKGGEFFLVDAAMITLSTLYPYFDGDTPDSSQFAYDWEGTPNASVSLRSPQTESGVDPLADPDCDPIPPAPRPPAIVDDCIEESTLWRRYLYTIPGAEVAEWQSTLLTTELATGEQAVRQVRIRIYPNPFEYTAAEFDFTNYCAEQIISYMPPNTKLTIDGELERVFAEISGSGTVLAADHLLYGTGGGPATWSDLSCGISYLMTVDVPPEALQGNLTTGLTLTRRA